MTSDLCELPQAASDRHQLSHHVNDLSTELALTAVMTTANDAEDLVNGWIGGQGAVEDGKLPLETLRDVIAATTRLNHGCHELCTGSKFALDFKITH